MTGWKKSKVCERLNERNDCAVQQSMGTDEISVASGDRSGANSHSRISQRTLGILKLLPGRSYVVRCHIVPADDKSEDEHP